MIRRRNAPEDDGTEVDATLDWIRGQWIVRQSAATELWAHDDTIEISNAVCDVYGGCEPIVLPKVEGRYLVREELQLAWSRKSSGWGRDSGDARA